MAPLRIVAQDGPDGSVLTLEGELDIASAPELSDAIETRLADGGETLIVDLRGLEFIDSSGLRALIAADASARERDRRLLVVRGIPRVHRTFEVTRIDEHLTMLDAPPASSS